MKQYAKNLVEVMKDAKRGFPKYLDLSNPLHRDLVSEYFGGEQVMQEQYPLLYKSYSKAVEQGLGEVSYEGFCDGAIIYANNYNQESKKIEAAGIVGLTKRARVIFASINIMHGDEIIKQYNQMFSNRTTIEISCETECISEDMMDSEYTVNLYVSWEDQDSKQLRGMVTATQETTLSQKIDMSNSIEYVQLYHPTKKINGEHQSYTSIDEVGNLEDISVAYNRYYISGADYYYHSSQTESGDLLIQFDLKYKFVMNDGFKYLQGEKREDVIAILLFDQLGTVFHENPNPQIVVSGTDKQEVTVTIAREWNRTFPESVKASNRTGRLFLQHYIPVQDKNAANIIMPPVTISNKLKNNGGGASEVICADIYFFWGCLAEGTKILMADGTEKEVQNIDAGESIINSKGETVKVTNLITGTEEYIYRTYTESGRLISASLLHPFAAERGDLLLRDFDGKTMLKVKNGDQYVYEAVINCYPEKYEGNVYSLELEDSGKEKSIIADGFVTYDNSEVERIIKETYVEENITLSPEEQEEFDRLKKMLESRN